MSNIAIKAENYNSYLEVKEIPSLNGWRAIAVMLVVIGHLKVTLPTDNIIYKTLDNLIFADFGVRIFFVLSGFLITTLLIKEKQKTGKIHIRNFFIRRFLRIVPVLWLYLFTVAVLNQLFEFNLSSAHFLGPLLYINNFNFFPGIWLLGHTWSLAVEEQFYLIWPFLFFFFKKTLNISVFFVIATPLIITITYFKPHLSNLLLEPFLRPAAAIFTGVSLALIWSKNFYSLNIKKYLKTSWFIVITIAILGINIFRHYGVFGTLLYPGGDTLLNLAMAYLITFSIVKEDTTIYKILNMKSFVKVGLLSYSIYIWQQLFIIPDNTYINWGEYLFFPINIIAVITVAYLSYYYFEKPFLRLKHKFSVN